MKQEMSEGIVLSHFTCLWTVRMSIVTIERPVLMVPDF